jgi:hypothetical protein
MGNPHSLRFLWRVQRRFRLFVHSLNLRAYPSKHETGLLAFTVRGFHRAGEQGVEILFSESIAKRINGNRMNSSSFATARWIVKCTSRESKVVIPPHAYRMQFMAMGTKLLEKQIERYVTRNYASKSAIDGLHSPFQSPGTLQCNHRCVPFRSVAAMKRGTIRWPSHNLGERLRSFPP